MSIFSLNGAWRDNLPAICPEDLAVLAAFVLLDNTDSEDILILISHGMFIESLKFGFERKFC